MTLHTIAHRGVPLGSVHIDATAGLVTAEFHPTAAFDAWRTLAVEVGNALSAAGFFSRDATAASTMAPDQRSAALDAGASWGRELELRGQRGELVPTSFIEIGAVPGEVPPMYVAWIGFERLTAAVPAAHVTSHQLDRAEQPPA